MSIGYDKYSINHQLLVNMALEEASVGAGPLTHDLAKPHHTFTLTGGSWNNLVSGLLYLDLNGAGDYLQCPAADSADINFTTEDISIVMWINTPGSATVQILMCQGHTDVDGWNFFVFTTNLSFRLNQGGAHTDISAVAALTYNAWQMVAVTRNGASGQFYVNGVPVATLLGTGLTDAVSCAAGNKLLVGTDDGEATYFLEGYIAGSGIGPRIWNRELSTTEIARIFATERHWFGI